MPEHRLQKTRDAYAEDRVTPWLEAIGALPLLPSQYRIWTDDEGVAHRERLPDRFDPTDSIARRLQDLRMEHDESRTP